MIEARAIELGWVLAVDGETGAATKGEQWIDVASSTPLFFLLAAIAEVEGEGFVVGYGGEQESSPELVAATSGETYTPEEPTPVEEPPAPADQRVLEALEAVTIPDPATATTEEIAAAVNAVVDVVKQALAPPA
jgi:hypothetical protein